MSPNSGPAPVANGLNFYSTVKRRIGMARLSPSPYGMALPHLTPHHVSFFNAPCFQTHQPPDQLQSITTSPIESRRIAAAPAMNKQQTGAVNMRMTLINGEVCHPLYPSINLSHPRFAQIIIVSQYAEVGIFSSI